MFLVAFYRQGFIRTDFLTFYDVIDLEEEEDFGGDESNIVLDIRFLVDVLLNIYFTIVFLNLLYQILKKFIPLICVKLFLIFI